MGLPCQLSIVGSGYLIGGIVCGLYLATADNADLNIIFAPEGSNRAKSEKIMFEIGIQEIISCEVLEMDEKYFLTIEEYDGDKKVSSDRAEISREEYIEIMHLILN